MTFVEVVLYLLNKKVKMENTTYEIYDFTTFEELTVSSVAELKSNIARLNDCLTEEQISYGVDKFINNNLYGTCSFGGVQVSIKK